MVSVDGDMDPERARQFESGGVGELDGDVPNMRGGGPSMKSSSGPLDRLLDGDAPGPGVDELQADYSLGREVAIVLRGVMRTATGKGVPPIGDILLGLMLWFMSQQDAPTSNSGSGETRTTEDGAEVRTGL